MRGRRSSPWLAVFGCARFIRISVVIGVGNWNAVLSYLYNWDKHARESIYLSTMYRCLSDALNLWNVLCVYIENEWATRSSDKTSITFGCVHWVLSHDKEILCLNVSKSQSGDFMYHHMKYTWIVLLIFGQKVDNKMKSMTKSFGLACWTLHITHSHTQKQIQIQTHCEWKTIHQT